MCVEMFLKPEIWVRGDYVSERVGDAGAEHVVLDGALLDLVVYVFLEGFRGHQRVEAADVEVGVALHQLLPDLAVVGPEVLVYRVAAHSRLYRRRLALFSEGVVRLRVPLRVLPAARARQLPLRERRGRLRRLREAVLARGRRRGLFFAAVLGLEDQGLSLGVVFGEEVRLGELVFLSLLYLEVYFEVEDGPGEVYELFVHFFEGLEVDGLEVHGVDLVLEVALDLVV